MRRGRPLVPLSPDTVMFTSLHSTVPRRETKARSIEQWGWCGHPATKNNKTPSWEAEILPLNHIRCVMCRSLRTPGLEPGASACPDSNKPKFSDSI